MNEASYTDFWVVLHTRTEHDDLDRLETRGARADNQAEAFDLLCEMACLTETQRSDHRLFLPEVDILQLCETLKELTGDEFEAMLYEQFVSRRTARHLPASLRPETFTPEPKELRGFMARRNSLGGRTLGEPYAKVEELPRNRSKKDEPSSWAQDLVRPRLKTLFSNRFIKGDGNFFPNTEPDEHDLAVRRLGEELKKDGSE